MMHRVDETAAYRAQVLITYPDARLVARTSGELGFVVLIGDGHTLGAADTSARDAWMDAAICLYRARTRARLN